MCQFLSFLIVPTPNGLSILTDGVLTSHDTIIKTHHPPKYYEGEWLDDDSVVIRVTHDTSEAIADKIATWVRANYTRHRIVNAQIISDLKAGIVPDGLLYLVHPKWNERTQQIFACDCAERVLPVWKRKYPDDKRPEAAIETTRRYADGLATKIELIAAKDAAKAAAKAAAGAAAKDAAGAAAGAAAWDAAWAAAWDAAGDAAWAAAKAAAGAAAWAAAGDAAWAAAKAAAKAAARAAAWDAAWAAERKWQAQHLLDMIGEEN
jgi:hypothetical protein